MKRIFTLIIITIFLSYGAQSQGHVNYNSSNWFLGLNMGGTYHSNTEVDVNRLYRGGLGFTVGKSFGREEGNFFSWDLRLRYLFAAYRGQSTSPYMLDSTNTQILNLGSQLDEYQQAYGYYAPNFHSWVNDWSLELQLNTNRLREKTGWNLFVFGGIGLTHYTTSVDLYDDAFGSFIKDETTLYDKGQFFDEYETEVVSKTDWMPHFGAGISKQISPNISFELMGRMSWTRNNDFDAMPNNMNGSISNINDRYHYASAGFKFYLGNGGGSVDHHTDLNTDTQNNNIVNNVNKPRKPIVDFTNPNTSPYVTDQFNFLIQANVYYVTGANNIVFKQNGIVSTNFMYDANTDEFSANVVLQPGQNIFELTGTNDDGTDQETTVIIFEQEDVVVKNPPIVTITNPSVSGLVVSNSLYAFSSTVLNVTSKQNITVVFNGNNITNFNYNGTSKIVTTSLNLIEGTNTVSVTGVNSDGTDSKTTKIIYELPRVKQPPVVIITNPGANPFYTAVNSAVVNANVLNVDGKANIEVKVNGGITNNFTYNNGTKQVQLNVSNLMLGVNVVSIKGTNEVGYDIASTTIIYRRPEAPKPPIVNFINPPSSPTTVYVSNFNLIASVLHVNSKNNITVKVNGVQTTNFTYSPSAEQINLSLILNQGSNVIEVKGQNADGQDSETTTIVYRRPVVAALPVVNIVYPSSDNQVFVTSNLTVQATVLNVASKQNITVKFNGVTTSAFTFNPSTKVVLLPVNLVLGNNTVQITGTNAAGSDSKTRIIIHEIPVVPTPPTVVFTNPPTTPYNVTNASFVMSATTTNIETKFQIVLKQNGVIVPANQYSFSNNNVAYNTTLALGNNIFEISVANVFGSDSKLAIVNLLIPEPCTPPTVGYISPQPGSTVTNQNVSIEAQINNYTNATSIELIHNGVSAGNMNYNSGSSIASKAVSLFAGSNSFEVRVSNDCGENQSTFVIVYKPANVVCDSPIITRINPGSASVNTDDATINLQIGVTGVTGSGSISVTNNGSIISFNYDVANHMLIVNSIALVEGINIIEVKATNDCGTEKMSFDITRTVCNPPVVTLSSSNDVTNSTYALVGSITNIDNAADVTVTLNGTNVNSNYNPATDVLGANLILVEGSNTIIVTANGCQTATGTLTVNYTAPCNVPVVTLSSSNNVTNSAYALVGSITNIDNAADVTVTLNGTNVNSTYNPATDILGANLTLVEGSNTIIVTANGCQTATGTLTVNYTAPCDGPIVDVTGTGMVGQNQAAGTVINSSYSIYGSVINVESGADVVVTLNGAVISSTYTAAKGGTISATFTLVEGVNTIVITANGCESVSQTIQVTYAPPCDVPVVTLSSSNDVTNSTYVLVGSITNIDNAANVTVTLNGTNVNSTYNPATDILGANLTLVEGTNTIIVTANGCQTVTGTLTVNYTAPCDVPVVTLSSSNDVTNSTYTLVGSITNIDNAADVTVTLNGTNVNSTYNPATDILGANLILVEGSNTIIVTANGCQTATGTLTVNYTAPCNVPVVTLSSSNDVTNSTYALVGSITNIDNAADVTVTLNGTNVNSTYNPATDILGANLTLVEGSNTIIVTANGCQTATGTLTVNYTAPCNVPVVTLSSSNDVTNSTYILVGSITNIDNAADVTVTLNGTNVNSTYNPETDILGANLTLVEGTNTIIVTANGCQTASGTLTVNYTAPCDVPVVTLSSSNDVTNSTYTLVGSITNIDNAADVTVTLNGTNVNSTYNPETDILGANLTLVEGSNTIIVTANGCQTESGTLTVNYTAPCITPIINAVNLTATEAISLNGGNVTTYVLTAVILNVNNVPDVEVTLNGIVVNSTFNIGSGALSASFLPIEGLNTVIITVDGCEIVLHTETFNFEEEEEEGPCGPRFNPGNSEWQFCLITPSGTYTRDDLHNNNNFSYSGSASSLYFKPIAGGGDAIVNGSDYPVQNGQYYLFTGNLTVDVSTSHPGSMGHWEVCVTSDTNPTHGNGNNRPDSPCEEDNGDKSGGADNGGKGGEVQQALNQPVITPISPNGLKKTVNTSTLLFKANLSDIKTKSDISMTVNRINYTSFMYSPSIHQLSGVIRLKAGNNTIVVRATNASGTTTTTYSINYQPQKTNNGKTNTGKNDGTKPKTNPTNTGKTNNSGTKTNNTNSGGGAKTNSGGAKTNSGGKTGGTKTGGAVTKPKTETKTGGAVKTGGRR